MKRWGKVTLVIIGALIITALGIDAADTLEGKGGTLLSSVIQSKREACPPGMLAVEAIPGVTCVDAYEASPGESCPNQTPRNSVETLKNVDTKECTLAVEKGKAPWTFISREQARSLCARSEKRLPTTEEWYMLSIGMADVEAVCNLDSGKVNATGAHSECRTPFGAYDLVGNVWEWMSDDISDGTYEGRTLPREGYVASVDSTGMALETSEKEDEVYGKDYFWNAPQGNFGILRGGYYGSGNDGGLYAVHAKTPVDAANAGIGFRCVR